jgi:hypothetical protein
MRTDSIKVLRPDGSVLWHISKRAAQDEKFVGVGERSVVLESSIPRPALSCGEAIRDEEIFKHKHIQKFNGGLCRTETKPSPLTGRTWALRDSCKPLLHEDY